MGYLRILWKFAASMRTIVVVLSLIAAVSVIGTLFPRLDPASENPLLHFMANTLSFADYYHAWWFQALLVFLCLNITVCSALRFPRMWRETIHGPSSPCPKVWQDRISSARPAPEMYGRAIDWLKTRGYKVRQSGSLSVFGHKGCISSWGVFIAHIAIVLVVAGGLWGSLLGFQNSVTLAQGESNQLRIADGSIAIIRLESFITQYYPNGQVADWVSRVVISQNGATIADREIRVNHPLLVRGIAIYQAAYTHRYHLRLQGAGLETRIYRLEEGQQLLLDEAGLRIMPLQFLIAGQHSQNPQIVFAWFDRVGRNGVASSSLGVPFSTPEKNGMLTFQAVDDISGLFIKHDPGLPLVYTGFILLAAGFFLSLYIPRRLVWVEVFPNNSGCTVSWSVQGRFQDSEAAAIQQMFHQQTEDRGDTDDLSRTFPS